MDDFIDPFVSSLSWSEMNGSAESHGNDQKNPNMFPSNIENIAAEDVNLYGNNGSSSIFIDSNMKYGIKESMFHGEEESHLELLNHTSHPSQFDINTCDGTFPFQGLIESASTRGSFGSELNTAYSVGLPHSSLSMSSSIESSGSEPSAFQASLGDAHSISSVPTTWPKTYTDVSYTGQGEVQGFGFEGVRSDADILSKTSAGNGRYLHADNLPATHHDQNELCSSQFPTFSSGQQIQVISGVFQLHRQENNEINNLTVPIFAGGTQIPQSKTARTPCQQLSQLTQGNCIKNHTYNSSSNQSHLASANTSAGNESGKPRVRARRGQATDPHSIAERLRREKIADRMKNLQELVPNSNKTDKSSMLDEIIDYVKFLQLQVKVLSMSRLGAAGAVVPLITDIQAEGSGSLLLSSSVGQRLADISESQDNLALEQEVVKLMESSVTAAMQYLQNKGLCLMPIALASAISSQKGSAAAIPPERRKPDASHNMISPSSLSVMERQGREDSCNGTVAKKEEIRSSQAM